VHVHVHDFRQFVEIIPLIPQPHRCLRTILWSFLDEIPQPSAHHW